ncbi:MAG: hypothetical protein QW549_03135 [Candidatus Micrarchaeaceae archaeon]
MHIKIIYKYTRNCVKWWHYAQCRKEQKDTKKGKTTRAKRKDQNAKVYEIKFDKSKISKQRPDALQRLFLEGKWFTNYIISKGITDSVSYNYKVRKVNIKVGDKFEERR